MPAAAVRPHAGEDPLAERPPGQQELPVAAEHIAGKRQVERRVVMMNRRLVRYPLCVSALIK
jgi:hypothetical protein